MKAIYWRAYKVGGEQFAGWAIEGQPGIYSHYAFAVAANMDLHEEYCNYHRGQQ